MQDKALELRKDGFWWPRYTKLDNGKYLKHAFQDLPQSVKYCTQRRVAIQAGGHVGMWPRVLSSMFETVYTFEPHPENFRALVRNNPSDNVIAIRGALTDRRGPIELRVAGTGGGHNVKQIKEGDRHVADMEGRIPAHRIDDLALRHVDYIILDIEGFELPAIKGAYDTIAACRPVIVVEDGGHGVKKGRGDTFQELHDYLGRQHVYKIGPKVRNDVIFFPE